jgi:hypothetical protein
VLYRKGDDGAAPTTAVDGFNGTYIHGATTSTIVPPIQFPNSR